MAINAEKLNIILSARDKEFTKAMDRSQKRVAHFASKSQKNLSKTGKSFNALGDAAKRLGPALLAAFSVQAFKGAVDSAVQIDNLSTLAGVSVERFQVLSMATSQFGIEQEKLADILKDVNDKFGDFTQTGAGPLADFFENIAPKVGLTAAAFADLSSESKLGAYISALEEANVTQSEMTFYMEAIASDSTALVAAFENNSAAIKEMEQRASELGVVLDEETIAKARLAKAELGLMSKVISANLSQALLQIAPLAIGAAEAIAKIASALNSLGYSATSSMNADQVKALAAEYKDVGKELAAVTQAQAAYNSNAAEFGQNSDRAVAWAKRLTTAEETLATAVKKRQDRQSSIDAAASGIKTIKGETRALKEQSRLREIGAEAVERARIRTQRAAYEKTIYDNVARASGVAVIDLTDAQMKRATELGGAYEKAAISASLILNPVKSAAAATKEVKEEAVSAKDAYDDMLSKMLEASPALKALGFDTEGLGHVMSSVENSMDSAFMSIIDGTSSASDAFKSMASSIISELYRVLVVKKITGFITGAIGGLAGGGAPTSSLRPQARPRASGGSAKAGQSYMTGEHGRELFVPQVNGRILSAAQTNNASGGGGDGVTVIQNNTFGNGVSRAEVNAMLPKMVEATKSAVADAKLRGGAYGRSFA
tara:strand:- start:6005 stop:7978 length:1974 start_codon:yes stop_codon:yes gene_type:complete